LIPNEWKSFKDKIPKLNRKVVIKRKHNKKMVVATFKKIKDGKGIINNFWRTEHSSYYLIDQQDIWIYIPELIKE
jgi:hypothetical protein